MPLIVEQLKDKTNPSRLMFNLTKISKFSTTIRKLTWITRIKFHRPFRSFLYFTAVQNKIEYRDNSQSIHIDPQPRSFSYASFPRAVCIAFARVNKQCRFPRGQSRSRIWLPGTSKWKVLLACAGIRSQVAFNRIPFNAINICRWEPETLLDRRVYFVAGPVRALSSSFS